MGTLSIKHRLWLLNVISAAITILIGAAAVGGLLRASQLGQVMVKGHARNNELAGKVRSEAEQLRRHEKDVFLNLFDQKAQDASWKRWQHSDATLNALLKILSKQPLPDGDKRDVERLHHSLKRYEDAMRDIRADIRRGRIVTPRAANAALEPATSAIADLDASGDRLVKGARARLNAKQEELGSLTFNLMVLVALVGLVLIVTNTVVSRLVGRSIDVPLARTVKALEAVAGGDLGQQVEIERDDEIGRMAAALNQAMDQMRQDREQIERLAFTDPLTSLLNRRAFTTRLDAELARVTRYGQEMTLLLMDVDHFKKVNDTHGHPTGDLVLQHMGSMLHKALRVTDIAGRWGGEEFVVALTHTEIERGRLVAERVRIFAEALEIVSEEGAPVPITISVGVSQARPGDSLAELVERADRAMYAAKSGGRNRVVMAIPTAAGDQMETSADSLATVSEPPIDIVEISSGDAVSLIPSIPPKPSPALPRLGAPRAAKADGWKSLPQPPGSRKATG